MDWRTFSAHVQDKKQGTKKQLTNTTTSNKQQQRSTAYSTAARGQIHNILRRHMLRKKKWYNNCLVGDEIQSFLPLSPPQEVFIRFAVLSWSTQNKTFSIVYYVCLRCQRFARQFIAWRGLDSPPIVLARCTHDSNSSRPDSGPVRCALKYGRSVWSSTVTESKASQHLIFWHSGGCSSARQDTHTGCVQCLPSHLTTPTLYS